MAKRPPNNGDESPPRNYPQTTPPQDLYATSDIRFVMRDLGAFGANIVTLQTEVSELKKGLATLTVTVDRFRTGAIVAATLLVFMGGTMGGFAWWMVGEQLTSIRDAVIKFQHPEAIAGSPPTTSPPR